MLTCKTIEPQKAVSYFVRSYYLQDTSRWFGHGADKLGLSGAVDDVIVFKNIVEGFSPNGRKKLGGKRVKVENRRAGVDCTFSAPKSVSLTALVGGDDRLMDAHRMAVEKTLALIEQRYSHTRVRTGNERIVTTTGNLVVAEFDHIENRNLDPHLHTHCVIMNMTEVSPGKWYAHHNEAIYANKKLLGMIYQHHLAREVQKLGYEIESVGKGQFEIKGYKREDLDTFSTRRQQISELVRENATWHEREQAWEEKRKTKATLEPDELKSRLKEQAKALGIEFVQSKDVEHKTEYNA